MQMFNNDDVERLLPMATCLEALEDAYRAWAAGRAISRPRSDTYLPLPTSDDLYVLKSMDAVFGDQRIGAIRLNSDVIRWEQGPRGPVKKKVPAGPGGTWVGLVLLFSTETGEPLAMLPDGVMQRLRVAATSALAARYLAREDAATVGLLGTGWQAGAHAPAMCTVRAVHAINVYSPTPAKREAFAQEMTGTLGIPVTAVDTAEAAVAGADIIVSATNALSRVVDPDWVRPGVHLTCVKASELGSETIGRAGRVVVHNRKTAPDNYIAGLGDERIEAHDPIDLIRSGTRAAAGPRRSPAWMGAPELKDVVAGTVPGRQSPDEITCFVNNMGAGLQFAALGAALLTRARAYGGGHEVPTEWFLEHVHP